MKGSDVAVVGGLLVLAFVLWDKKVSGGGGGGGGGGTGSLQVNVTPANANVIVSTSPMGNGLHQNITAGTYDWSAYLDGYATKTGQVTIVANQTASLDIILDLIGSGGGSAFVFGTPSASARLSWPGSSQAAVTFSVNVQNSSGQAENHTLQLMEQYIASDGGTVGPMLVNDSNGVPLQRVLTLNAGASEVLSFDSGAYSAVFPYGYGLHCQLWLQDEAGNKSAVITVS